MTNFEFGNGLSLDVWLIITQISQIAKYIYSFYVCKKDAEAGGDGCG